MNSTHPNKTISTIWAVILVLSLLLILAGTFEFFQFENPKTNNRISALGFILQVAYYGKEYYYRVILPKKKRR